MPLIQMEIAEGYPTEVRRELHDRLAGLALEVLGGSPAAIRTRVTEVSFEGWGAEGAPESATRMLPLVRMDILEGRSLEVRHELHDRVARLVAEVLSVPLDSVRTYITEMSVDGWGIGGVPASIARRDAIEARRRAAG